MLKGPLRSAEEAVKLPAGCRGERPRGRHGLTAPRLGRVARGAPPCRQAADPIRPAVPVLPGAPPAGTRPCGFLGDAACASEPNPALDLKQMDPFPPSFPSLPITCAASAVNASIPPHSSFFQFIFCLPSSLENGFLSISLSQKASAPGCRQRLLNKDSYFHLPEGEHRPKATLLSRPGFGEALLYKKKSNIE